MATQLLHGVSQLESEVAKANIVQHPTGRPTLSGRNEVWKRHSVKHSSIQAFQNLSADAAKRDSSPGQALVFRSRPRNPPMKAPALRCATNFFERRSLADTEKFQKRGAETKSQKASGSSNSKAFVDQPVVHSFKTSR